MSRVTGTLELRRVSRLLKEAPPHLRKEMARNIRNPIKPFTAKVKSETFGSVPARYAGVLAPAIKTSISSALGGGSGLGYTLVVYAKGKAEDRDLAAVNAGILRHKTWGHEPWHAQGVRGGMVDRAIDDLGRKVAQEIEKAVDAMAARIEGG